MTYYESCAHSFSTCRSKFSFVSFFAAHKLSSYWAGFTLPYEIILGQERICWRPQNILSLMNVPSWFFIDKWLNLFKKEFTDDLKICVGVHCVTVSSRVPNLVALTLIDFDMRLEEATQVIRTSRHSAINNRQLDFLAKYKKQKYFITGKTKCHFK